MTSALRNKFDLAPGGASQLPWLICLVGLLVAYVPTFSDMFKSSAGSEDLGHVPIVMALSVFLVYQKWSHAMTIEGDRPAPAWAWPIVVVACSFYALGRSQGIQLFEVGSLIWLLAGLVLLLRGPKALRALWFAFFFMLFFVPLPSVVVDTLTQPMKIAVSHVAEHILHAAGYPVARWGVILHVGPYQLMVADACAGLTTLLTLEAIGLLYLNLVRYASVWRNIALAILIVPISFTANVIRVITLTLITFYFGDEAGQGFIHSFAGIVLFVSALLLIISADSILRLIVPSRPQPAV
jgi:exosortase B